MDNPILIEAVRRAAERRAERERSDPVELARRCGIEPDKWQAEVLRSRSQQLILNCCRQSGKSSIASLLALHQALYSPGSLCLLIAPALRQSAELFRKFRESFAALQGQSEIVTAESSLRLEFENGSRIVALPGSQQTIRGFSSVSLLVCDEAAFISDELYASVRPMLAVSRGRTVLLSTPFGRRGFFFEIFERGGPEWERYKITADECPRISSEWLEAERLAIGPLFYASEYQCQFTDNAQSVFSSVDIERALSDSVKQVEWWRYE